MIGLRGYERDRTLPAMAGRPAECPLRPDHLLDLCRTNSVRSTSPELVSLDWVHARWRPGASTTCTYVAGFTDGEERVLVAKRYNDRGALTTAARKGMEDRLDAFTDRLHPVRAVESESVVLWAFPVDRALPGTLPLHDRRRLARLLEENGLVPRRSVRRRRTTCTLLRYKPEHRAVWRVRASLRDTEVKERVFAARAMRPERAAQLARVRAPGSPVGASGLVPRMLAHDAPSGLVLEEWLEGRTFDSAEFGHAREAGRVLRLLHALPTDGAPSGCERVASSRRPEELLELFPDLPTPPAPATSSTSNVRSWTHGDFHPDQILLRPNGQPFLLDLDQVGLGDPLEDLSSWIADHLEEHPDLGYEAAVEPLLEGYSGVDGFRPRDRDLRLGVAAALRSEAAGAIRRLEKNATRKARRLLQLANVITDAGDART